VSRNRPLVALGALILAVALIVAGVVYASSGPTTPTSDPLVLNGHAPRTAELIMSVATGGLLSVSGTLWIDAATSSLSAKLEVPLVSSSTEFDVRAVHNELYLTSPNLADASGPVWYVLHATWPSITRFAKDVVDPNATLLTLLANARTMHHGFDTTYELTRSHVSLGTFGDKKASPAATGNLKVRVTTGAQGEFTGIWASLQSGGATTTVSMDVVSYNRSVTIVAPPRSRATTPAGPLLQQLLSSGALGSLVLPSQLLQLLSRAKLS
jgi:hypothetical protein